MADLLLGREEAAGRWRLEPLRMPRNNHSIQKFFAELGPGLITGAVMGNRVNPPLLKWLGCLAAAVMAGAAIAMFVAG